jgi:two-component system, chemotaxis family, chemotaxis protein CheY
MELNALVIDDSGIMRKMVMRALTESQLAKFQFTEAEDGVDGLAKFNPKTTDIVFVDWNMPNMDGIDLVQRIRSQVVKRHVPIVMVTTEKLVGKVEEALEYGVDCFISKPFTAEGMEKRLAPLLEKIQGSQASSGGGGFFKRLIA